MYFIQARFKNGFFDVLRREVKVFETFDEVTKYLESINTQKDQYIMFKGSKSLQGNMKSYSYDFVNKQLHKGKVEGARAYTPTKTSYVTTKNFASPKTPIVSDIE